MGDAHAGQWATGMYPHIIFSNDERYFPGPSEWDPDGVSARPHGIGTSGISQPPVHGFCLEVLSQISGWTSSAEINFFGRAVESVARSHEWLVSARMNNPVGLIEIHHGWESGMDNSPRFDLPYAHVEPSKRKLRRTDIQWADRSERPSSRDYQRYMRLVEEMAKVHFDDVRVKNVSTFRVGDVFATACLAMSAKALGRLAERLGRKDFAHRQSEIADLASAGVSRTVDAATGLCRDYDLLRDQWSPVGSLASFSLLVAGLESSDYDRQLEILLGSQWAGHPSLQYKLPPSCSPEDPNFDCRKYWRGPVWPIMNWLFAERLAPWAPLAAESFRDQGLAQLCDLVFGEYYDPLGGRPLGSPHQSWTAMVAIDWILAQPR